jgi:hypothetical protein
MTVLAASPRTLIGVCVAVTRGAAKHPPAAAGGNLAEFLDIDVDQIAGPGRLDAPDQPSGGAVEPAQFGQPVAGQHAMHGGGV